jgi:endonuclease/exonuclease/phosphatase (EEP) superfamily protein YafD
LALAGLVPLLVFLRVSGERASIFGGLLYLPHAIWAAPFVALALLSAFAARRWALLNLAAAGAVALFYADFAWGGAAGRESGPADLVVATNNVGQSNRQSPAPFFEAEKPDLILVQEGFTGGRALAGSFPGYFRESRGEFLLLSRHPILGADLLRLGTRRYPVAARFEVAVRGERMAVYNVHLPTPRGDLLKLFSPESVGEMIEVPPWAAGPSSVRQAMRDRVRLGRDLATAFAAEKLPMVAGGDFNMPGNGYLSRVFSGGLRDAFSETGFGYGFTFPGYTRNPLSVFGPWLRLDYLYCSPDWEPRSCVVERSRHAQHRAVVARFARAENPEKGGRR